MENIIVARHRNRDQFYSRNRGRNVMKVGPFGSLPSGKCRGFNCGKFQSREGLLPTPCKPRLTKIPFAENTLSSPLSPKTPSPPLKESWNVSKGTARSRTIEIPIKLHIKNTQGGFCFSERWAGPAYSNSPPPSSLPIPNFSVKPKRTVSLDLPTLDTEFNIHPTAKSAPATPTRERSLSPCSPFALSDYTAQMSRSPSDSFDFSDSDTEKSLSSCDQYDISVSATMTLRRILNLDSTDELRGGSGGGGGSRGVDGDY